MKKIKYLLFLLITFLTSMPFVKASECMYCSSDSMGIPALIPKFVSNGITFFQLLIPVILIIVGMVQFTKAMASGEDKVMSESVRSFIRSIAAGIAVFLLVAIVRTVFSTFLGSDGQNTLKCVSCFMNFDENSCSISACPVRPQACSGLNETECKKTAGCTYKNNKCVYDSNYKPGYTAKKDCNEYIVKSEGCPTKSASGQLCKTINDGHGNPICRTACSTLSSNECNKRDDCTYGSTGGSSSVSCHDK